MITKAFPKPLLTGILLATWLLALGTLHPGAIVLGFALSWVIALVTDRFWPDAPKGIRVKPIFGFLAIALYDVVVANVEVAWIILTRRAENLEPHFVEIPLELDHPLAITILADTISLTPGTVSTNLSGDQETLLVHSLDCPDQEEEIAAIKRRYESRLREIFND
jgi:multicomponent K+:H+ antiporter subunit E